MPSQNGVAPGEGRLVGLGGEPVEQEVGDDGVSRLAVGGGPEAPEALRVDARGAGSGGVSVRRSWLVSFTRASGGSRGRPRRARSTTSWPSSGATDEVVPGERLRARGPRRWCRRRCISSRGRGRGSGASGGAASRRPSSSRAADSASARTVQPRCVQTAETAWKTFPVAEDEEALVGKELHPVRESPSACPTLTVVGAS